MKRRIVGPALPVTVEEAKANARIDTTVENAEIEGYIRAALAHIEMSTGVAFQAQTWEIVLDAFPAGAILIPYGNVTSVVGIGYIDPDGVSQSVEASNYAIDATGFAKAWVVPVVGFSWPATMSTINAVSVQFVAGEVPPDDIRQAILLLTTHYYENRSASGAGVPLGVELLMSLHRRIFV